ncbi:MAG TPA: DUF305 domain-containing protein [Gemmatimonadales bacterium]|jgi:uncharacterized protein (DUF305 family)|nr:DUF305 domain-containing protein [Gemmatimonadales bacterium]
MTAFNPSGFVAALLAGWVLTACGSPSGEVRSAPEPVREPHTAADARFMTHMIHHHAQALVMGGWAPAHDASPTVQRLAERIVAGQLDEIALMQRWLRDRRLPVPQVDSSGMVKGTAMDHSGGTDGAHHGQEMAMPGMLTDAQLRQLDQARGREFDRLFLTYMIQHHKGAVTMVRDLFGTPGAAQVESVFKLANDISADQTSEISRMQRMLATIEGSSP